RPQSCVAARRRITDEADFLESIEAFREEVGLAGGQSFERIARAGRPRAYTRVVRSSGARDVLSVPSLWEEQLEGSQANHGCRECFGKRSSVHLRASCRCCVKALRREN